MSLNMQISSLLNLYVLQNVHTNGGIFGVLHSFPSFPFTALLLCSTSVNLSLFDNDVCLMAAAVKQTAQVTAGFCFSQKEPNA